MLFVSISNRSQILHSRKCVGGFQRRCVIIAGSRKGFGDNIAPQKQDSGKKKSKRKGKQLSGKEQERRRKQQENMELAKQGAKGVAAGYAGYGMNNQPPPTFQDNREVVDQDEKDFEKRLASLKETGNLLAKEKRVEQQSSNNSVGDIYANPPKIADVLSPKKDEKEEESKVSVGLGQFAIVGGSILLIAVFAITNGVGDLFVGQKQQQQTQQIQELSQEEKDTIQKNVDDLANNLKGDESDVVNLRSIAAAEIALGEYKQAEGWLLKLSQIQKDDIDTWTLLAQTRAALGDTKGKVDAYQTAVKVDQDKDIQLLQELAGALISDGRPQEAIKLINDQISSINFLEQQNNNNQQQFLESPKNTDYQNNELDFKNQKLYNDVELQLLLGKVYSQWSGHSGDALAVFDGLIKQYPEDFRGYLAKGVLFRNLDKKSDAERMFLQAKFYAPISKKSLVDQVVQFQK